MAEAKKYYWLKLHKDFFKRHDIRVVEAMDNGKDYILFYMKLLLESVDHEGFLRFSNTIPYNEKTLSVITNTNIDIVRGAIEIFRKLNLMEILDDETIFMTQTKLMLGVETEWAQKKREYRAKLLDTPKTKKDDFRQEIDIEKEIELDIDKDIINIGAIKGEDVEEVKVKSSNFKKPTIEEIGVYCKERKNNIDPEAFWHFYESKNWHIGKTKMKSWKSAVITWEKRRPKGSLTGNQFKELQKIQNDLAKKNGRLV